MLKEFWK